MIPKQLSLKNFLSYRDASLDFRGLHTACICGPNGAGKSSLLEAIAWSIWGECRGGSDDDIIHLGEMEVKVDFIFSTQNQIYRVIRNHRRGQTTHLEFQIATNPDTTDKYNFRALTERGLKATQQKILDYIKLDYETFVNSAYLRQGHAEEFMIKKPKERKDVLVNLLKLNQYDTLAEQAKEFAKKFKARVDILEESTDKIKTQLLDKHAIVSQTSTLQETIAQLQLQQKADTEQLRHLQGQQHHRQTWEKLLNGQKQQYDHLSQEWARLQQELTVTKQQKKELEALLLQEEEINGGLAHFQDLQTLEETLSLKFKQNQEAQGKRQQLQELQRQKISQLQGKIQQVQAQLDALEQQEKETQDILKQLPDVEAGFQQLQTARSRLNQLEELQVKVAPLVQRRQQVEVQIERAQARLAARLEELNLSTKKMRLTQEKRKPQLEKELGETSHQITELEKKRVYQQRVREKGQERHQFLERLNANKRDYEARLAELEQKIKLLEFPPQNDNLESEIITLPLCPLCDRALDEHHLQLVIKKQQTQQQELWDQLWIVREQLTLSEREIQVLRNEYRLLEEELVHYQELREKRGIIQSQLQTIDNDLNHLQELLAEANSLENSLKTGDYARELYTELNQIDAEIKNLNYNQENHALARNDEKRWRWVEVKLGQIKEAQNKLQKLNQRRPELQVILVNYQQELEQENTNSELQRQIREIENYITEIGYSLEEHSALRREMRDNQFWLSRVQELRQAQQLFPQLDSRIHQLMGLLEVRTLDLENIKSQLSSLQEQLEETPDPNNAIITLEKNIQQRRQSLDQQLGSLGRLQQQQQYLESLESQQEAQKEHITAAKRQYRVYQELAQAFGKNGIQALMIENILPQLEAETNQILSRLSANQLHVQFITQRATKATKSSKKEPKFIDTLDILIADARGTRSYETYSGGEAFRISFAIRLALAKLLAQRAGTALQLLVIDEGFGTQDSEGCDRLISAINAIASDFACILTVTHIPHLKEAFQARVEVTKTPQGSRISLSI
jgi:DNA repair protein SbcC/Rad50